MKRIASFAAALMMAGTVMPAALPALNACASGTEVVEVSDTQELGKQLSHSVTVKLFCMDRSVIPTGITLTKTDDADKIKFTGELTHEKLVSVLESNGKTLNDFATFVISDDLSYPAGHGIDDDCAVKASMKYRFEEKDEAGNLAFQGMGYANADAGIKDTLNSPIALKDFKFGQKTEFEFEVLKLEVNHLTTEQINARQLQYLLTVSASMKDGSKIDTGIVIPQDQLSNSAIRSYYKDISIEQLEKILADNSKTMDDFSSLCVDMSMAYPGSVGVTDETYIDDLGTAGVVNPIFKPDITGPVSSGDTGSLSELPVKGTVIEIYSSEPYNEFTKSVSKDGKTEYAPVTLDDLDGFSIAISLNLTDTTLKNTGAVPDIKTGDLNGDKVINVTDISMLAAHVKGIKPLTDEQKVLADLNGDGRIDVTDVSKLAGHVKGIKPL